MNVKADIVFFGDSLTYYGDFSSLFPDKVVCNLGLRGDTIQGMIDRVEQVKLLEPRMIFLMAGINDVTKRSLNSFESSLNELVNILVSQIKDVDLIIHSLLPVNDMNFSISCNNDQIVSYNEIICRISANYKLKYIDLFSLYAIDGELSKEMTIDGLHLKSGDYNKWYKKIKLMV
jgi:lysophospholipase L1-like esterase